MQTVGGLHFRCQPCILDHNDKHLPTLTRQLYANFQPTVQLDIRDKKLRHKGRSYAARPGSIQKAFLTL